MKNRPLTPDSLAKFAAASEKTHFVDVVRRFDDVGRGGLFVDACCHLSDAGARVEAQALYEATERNGDLGVRKP